MRQRPVAAADSAATQAEAHFHFRLEKLIDLPHPLAGRAWRMPWHTLEEAPAAIAPPRCGAEQGKNRNANGGRFRPPSKEPPTQPCVAACRAGATASAAGVSAYLKIPKGLPTGRNGRPKKVFSTTADAP